MTTETRLECLRLAVEAGAPVWDVMKLADEMLAFVEHRPKSMQQQANEIVRRRSEWWSPEPR